MFWINVKNKKMVKVHKLNYKRIKEKAGFREKDKINDDDDNRNDVESTGESTIFLKAPSGCTIQPQELSI